MSTTDSDVAALIYNETPGTSPDDLVRGIDKTASHPEKSSLNQATAKEQLYIIRDMNRKFRHACSQLILMNNLIDEIEVRYHRAQASERRSYRYILRLRLCTIEGVRNMFYEYAYARADQLEQLQLKLYNEHSIAWSERHMEETDDEEEAEEMDEEEEDEEGVAEEEEESFHSLEDSDDDSDATMDFE